MHQRCTERRGLQGVKSAAHVAGFDGFTPKAFPSEGKVAPKATDEVAPAKPMAFANVCIAGSARMKGNVMKRLIAILILLAMLTACLPTPEQEFVISKRDADIDTAVLTTAAPIDGETVGTADGEAANVPHVALADRLGAPAHCTEEVFEKKVPFDMLTVSIDADVHVPDTARVGVYTATFDVPFSEAQQKALILKYLGEERPFLLDIGNSHWRRWQIEEQIKAHQKELEWANTLEPENVRDLMVKQSNRHLNEAMEDYKSAPEDWAHLDWDGALSEGRGEKATRIELYANTDQPAHYRMLRIGAYGLTFRDESRPAYQMDNARVNDRDAITVAPNTDEERTAAALAEQELNGLGVGTFTVKSVEPSTDTFFQASQTDYPQTGVFVQLWYTVDGLPFYDFQAWHGSDDLMNYVEDHGMKEAQDYSVYMPGQYRAEVCVRNGEVVSIELEGMHCVTGCVNDNVQLLPFEKILETFREQIAYHYYTGDWENPDSGKGETLRITDIRLSMMRVRKKDSPEEFYLMPVWDFSGYIEYPMHSLSAEEIEQQKQWSKGLSFLTINAVDGTVIDRNLGY